MESPRTREEFYKKRKAAMQLSVSMMVMLIISIVIFGFGIYLAGQVFTLAEQTEASISAQTQKEIESRIMQSGDPVSIPFNKKKVLTGESHAFALGILNTFKEKDTFIVEMSFSNAFDTQDPTQKLTEPDKNFINNNWIFTEIPPLENVKRNEAQVIPLSVQVNSEMAPRITTKRGTTYVFNICVYALKVSAPTGLCRLELPIPRDRIRGELHGKRISKIYVEVV